MKKFLCIVLFGIFLLSITGCGGNSNSIQLTKDNYKKYLNIEAKCFSGSLEDSYGVVVPITDTYTATRLYSSIVGNLKVSGASTNFNYNDIKIVVKILGTYKAFEKDGDYKTPITKNFEMIMESSPNISGNADTVIKKINLDDNLLTHEYLLNYDTEVVEISGSVTPAN